MKRCLTCLLALLLALLPGIRAGADPITFTGAGGSVTADTGDTSLDMGDVRVEADDWEAFIGFLHALPALERVDMFSTPVDRENIERLAGEFPGLAFGWTMVIPCDPWHGDHVIRTDAEVFSTLHVEASTAHTSEELDILRYCKGLKALDLGHNALTDISFLADLPDLRVLIIAINHISDLTPLSGLSRLEYLEVFNNELTDLTPLAGLTHLLDLNIAYNYIPDFSPLHGLPQLKRLWMPRSHDKTSWTFPPDEQIAALREHLPKTTLMLYGDPTDNGWRDNAAHYAVIYQIFHSGTYMPFADSFPAAETP